MSETSSNLALPFIQPAQAQKHVTHNEAIERLDVIVQLTVQAFAAETPPASPTEGQTWALGAAPLGDWVGQAGQLASWAGGGWLFLAPQTGWQAYGVAEGVLRVYTSGTWASAVPDLDNLAGVGVNATADTGNRLSVSSPATLLNHEGAGHQLKLNKSASGETASLLYQTGFSGRAEMGTTGTDDFAIKVSADGAAWFDALSVAGATGHVNIAHVLHLTPGAAPVSPTAGDIYFDSAMAKLRCFDGTLWQDAW